MIPEYCFAVAADESRFAISDEHRRAAWFTFDDGLAMLHWESNRGALVELNRSLIRNAAEHPRRAL